MHGVLNKGREFVISHAEDSNKCKLHGIKSFLIDHVDGVRVRL
jgi:hypothetical protein